MVTGCKNNSGKGYKVSTFSKHIRSHKMILLQSSNEREKVSLELEKLGNSVLCKRCCMVVAFTSRKRICKSCSSLDESGEVSIHLSNSARDCLITKIHEANRSHFRILTEIPKSLRRLWSDCVSTTLMKFARAKTDYDSFRALESWVKLKSVLVLPLRVNKQRASNRKFHLDQMLNWIAENEEDCWERAIKIEQERHKANKKKA